MEEDLLFGLRARVSLLAHELERALHRAAQRPFAMHGIELPNVGD